ncbi:MAG: hypothetical protein V4438_03540 [Patescibacteria group bacterium]
MKISMNKKWQLSVGAFVILLLLLMIANKSFADSANLPVPTEIPELEEQISTDVSPSSPKPGDTVTITLSAFGTDLNTANISWSVNGSIVKSGKGNRILQITAGKSGSATSVIANIKPENGSTIRKIFSINPETVDIVWEARTYSPPFYRGKSLFSPQAEAVFVAMPNLTSKNGVTTPPNKVTYIWRQDTRVVGDRSGYGVNAFLYKGKILASPVIIDVAASDGNGLQAENYISLSPFGNMIGVYENSPIYGILFGRELSGGFDFGDKEERTISAYPYYFGITSKSDPDLSYSWAINGSTINVPEAQNEMTLRNSNGETGQSILDASITNNANILEGAKTESVVNFAKPSKVFPL